MFRYCWTAREWFALMLAAMVSGVLWFGFGWESRLAVSWKMVVFMFLGGGGLLVSAWFGWVFRLVFCR